jgi:hypothetical protein
MTPIIYQSRLSLLYLGFGVIGGMFSGALAYWTATTKWVAASGTSEATAQYVDYGTLIFFGGLSATCVFMTLMAKRLVLTSDSLYINRPFLFLSRRIVLNDILRLTSKDYQITSSHRHTNFTVYDGKQTTIYLIDGSIIRYNSFEVSKYYTFTANLQNELRRYKAKLNYPRLQRQDRQWQGYGWLLFATILTGSLLISLYLQYSAQHQ